MKTTISEATGSAIIMVKAASMSTLNHDENEGILRNGSQESVELALVKHACFNENDDI